MLKVRKIKPKTIYDINYKDRKNLYKKLKVAMINRKSKILPNSLN